MKQTIHIALITAVLFIAACTKHAIDPLPQVPESSRSYIFFEPEVVETKANLVTGETLPTGYAGTFGVLGYCNGTSLFTSGYTNGVARVYRNNDGIYQYDNLGMWMNGTADHKFYAFHPYSLSVNANNGDPFVNYSLPATEAEMVDILTAYTSTPKCSLVPLTFYHRLWALDLEITNNQTENPYNPDGSTALAPNLSIVSAVLTLTNLPSTGTLELDGTTTVGGRTATQSYTLFNSSSSTTDREVTSGSTVGFGPLLFFPTTVAYNETNKVQYRIDLVLKNPWGVEYEFSYPGTAGTYRDFKSGLTSFEAGKRYSLKVVKGNGDSFTVSVDDEIGWDDEVDVDHTFN